MRTCGVWMLVSGVLAAMFGCANGAEDDGIVVGTGGTDVDASLEGSVGGKAEGGVAGASGREAGGVGGGGMIGSAGTSGGAGSPGGGSGSGGTAGASGQGGAGFAGSSGSAGGAGQAGVGGEGGGGVGGHGGGGGSAGSTIYGTPRQSCGGGLDCGGVSCCDSILVPGGVFPMGRSSSGSDAYADGFGDEQPEHDATVAEYYLDTFEVTVGRFRRFVEEYSGPPPQGAAAHPLIEGSGWQDEWSNVMPVTRGALIANISCDPNDQTWTDDAGENEVYPINCVNWYEALAFCAWDGGRLPTEAEWEYAAAGGVENRQRPWGIEDPSANTALANDKYSDESPFIAVGSHAAGTARWGHQDLAGSMNEWVTDWYDGKWYSGNGAACLNCANLTESEHRVVRGGSWSSYGSALRAAYRFYYDPSQRLDHYGFRCARNTL